MEQWELIEEYKHQGIELKALRSNNAPIGESFDLALFWSTFESRGLVSSNLLKEKSCTDSVIVFFEEEKETPLRSKNDKILIEQVTRCTKNPVTIINNISIKDIEESLRKIFSKIPQSSFRRNTNWFIDISGASTPFFLSTVAHLLKAFPSPSLVLFNPTGSYKDGTSYGFRFTSGFDRNIWIPSLWGQQDPSLPWTYVFLLGFNGDRSYEVLYRCEPKKVKALIGNPGYQKSYVAAAIKKNDTFLRQCGLWSDDGKHDLIMADASNPIDSWKKLQEIVIEERNRTNICFVPLGPKAHALGSGLCAITDGKSAVLYSIPRTYIVKDVPRGEYIWKYEITK